LDDISQHLPSFISLQNVGAAHLGQGAINKGVGFCQDFRDFLTKGNAFDLAVAFILSTALSAVIRSMYVVAALVNALSSELASLSN